MISMVVEWTPWQGKNQEAKVRIYVEADSTEELSRRIDTLISKAKEKGFGPQD